MDNLNKLKNKIGSLFNKSKKYIPNILTTLRLMAVPFFLSQFLSGNFLASTVIFSSACITDALDGYLARRWNVQSKYGKTIDPLADKSIVLSSLILYTIKYNMIMLIPIILETLIAAVNVTYYFKNIDFSKLKTLNLKDKLNYMTENGKVDVYNIGKKKTILLMIMSATAVFNTNFNGMLEPIINTLLLITSSLEICTLSCYTYGKIIKNEKDEDNTDIKILEENQNSEVKEKTIQMNKKQSYEQLKKELEFLNKDKKDNVKINIKKFNNKN